MLVYIRASDKDKIICDVDENDIAEHLRVIFIQLDHFLYTVFSWNIMCPFTPDKTEEETERKGRQEKIQSRSQPLHCYEGY